MIKNVLIFLLIIFNIWLYYLQSAADKKQKYYSKQLEQTIENCQNEISDAIINELKYENQRLRITENARIRIHNEFAGVCKNKLIYRINFPYCESCIFPIIEKLDNQTLISKEKILIITAFPSNEYGEEFDIFMKNKSLNILNFSDLEFYFQSEGNFEPFLFMWNVDSGVHFLYNTKKCNSFVIDKYLEFIKNKL